MLAVAVDGTAPWHCAVDRLALQAGDSGWRVENLDAGYWPTLTAPALLTEALIAAAV